MHKLFDVRKTRTFALIAAVVILGLAITVSALAANNGSLNSKRQTLVAEKTALTDAQSKKIVAVFNLKDEKQKIHYEWKKIGIEPRKYTLRNLWEHTEEEDVASLDVTLPPHGSVLYRASH